MRRQRTLGPERYFFVHMQKTAGTTLLGRLRRHFGPDAVYPTPEQQGTPETSIGIDEVVERYSRHRDDIRVVTGHFPLCTMELLGDRFATLTVLRQPVDRTLSNLRHARRVDPRFRDAPLDDIYANDPIRREGLLRNHMVRMLSLTTEEMTAGALTQVVDDDARLERAKVNLVERIDVVGFQEHFEEFCQQLEARFGWDLGDPLFSNRTEPMEASDELVERILEDNQLDMALYDFALDVCRPRQGEPAPD